jgi:hypothetical protein
MVSELRFAQDVVGATAAAGFRSPQKSHVFPYVASKWDGQLSERLAVITDGFHGAAGLGFLAKANFLVIHRLLEDVAVAAGEIGRGRLAAQVTINALVIDKELAVDVLGELVC